MNKCAIITLSLLGISSYCLADNQEIKKQDDSVEVVMTTKIRADKDMKEAVAREIAEDARALVEKYEVVCGIANVKVSVEQEHNSSIKSESSDVTRKCKCKCKCNCGTCSSSNCCRCSSCGCCSCRSGELEKEELCSCIMEATRCTDCGKLVEELNCACGKPKPKDIEIDRCACGKPKAVEVDQDEE